MSNPTDPYLTKRRNMLMQDARVNALKGRDKLQTYVANVKAHPAIAKHLKERPGDDKEDF